MIKNEIQLSQAKAKNREFLQRISRLRKSHSGIELSILAGPLISMSRELDEKIAEYKKLRQQSLDEAILDSRQEPLTLGNIGLLLSRLRISTGLTQAELAEKLGWHQSNLSRFESETYDSQTISKVVEYASALGVWLYVVPSLTAELQVADDYPTADGYPVTNMDADGMDTGSALPWYDLDVENLPVTDSGSIAGRVEARQPAPVFA